MKRLLILLIGAYVIGGWLLPLVGLTVPSALPIPHRSHPDRLGLQGAQDSWLVLAALCSRPVTLDVVAGGTPDGVSGYGN